MPVNHAVLRVELNTDPRGYGYASLITSGDDTALAALVNKVRDGTDGFAAILVKRADIPSNELIELIDLRDLVSNPAPTPLHGAWLSAVLQQQRGTGVRLMLEDGTPTRVKLNLDRIIGNTNGSQTRLDAASQRHGSRGEQLFGTGTRVTDLDVAIALRSTP